MNKTGLNEETSVSWINNRIKADLLYKRTNLLEPNGVLIYSYAYLHFSLFAHYKYIKAILSHYKCGLLLVIVIIY